MTGTHLLASDWIGLIAIVAAPGLGLIASAIMLLFGLWWLGFVAARARRRGEGYAASAPAESAAGGLPSATELSEDARLRERASTSDVLDPAQCPQGHHCEQGPHFALAVLPVVVVVLTNMLMSLVVLPRIDTGFLADAGVGHKGSYRDIAMVMLGGTLMALVTIITLGMLFGSF